MSASLPTRRSLTRGRRMRRRTRRAVGVLVAVGAVFAGSTGAFAYWTSTGSGSGAGATSASVQVTLTSGSVTGNLSPGAAATVRTVASNGNQAAVAIASLVLDQTQGTRGFAVDAGHSACTAANFGFTPQTNGGSGWSVPAKSGGTNGTLTIDLANAVTLSTSAPDACQGAQVTVYLSAGQATYRSTVLATEGLQSFWRLGEASGTSFADIGGAANTGTWSGGPALGQTGAITGDADTAASFDGTDDYGSVQRQIQDDFAVEFWFKSTQGLGSDTHWYNDAGLVDAESPGFADDFGVSLRADGAVVAGIGNSSYATETQLVSQTGLNNGAWHHVVFTRARSTGAAVLYIDGVQKVQATGITRALSAATTLQFGVVHPTNNWFAGSLDDVSVYSSALSAAIVQSHFQQGRP